MTFLDPPAATVASSAKHLVSPLRFLLEYQIENVAYYASTWTYQITSSRHLPSSSSMTTAEDDKSTTYNKTKASVQEFITGAFVSECTTQVLL